MRGDCPRRSDWRRRHTLCKWRCRIFGLLCLLFQTSPPPPRSPFCCAASQSFCHAAEKSTREATISLQAHLLLHSNFGSRRLLVCIPSLPARHPPAPLLPSTVPSESRGSEKQRQLVEKEINPSLKFFGGQTSRKSRSEMWIEDRVEGQKLKCA